MKFENYKPEEIEKAIRQEFKNRYTDDNIEYVNAVYEIGDFYKISKKYNKRMKLKILLEDHKAKYVKENNCTEDDYNTKM